MGDDRPGSKRSGRITGSSVLTPPTGIAAVPDDAESLVQPPRSVEPTPDLLASAEVWTPRGAEGMVGSCLCGHASPAHEHWRPGSECAVCGPVSCPAFRRRGGRVRRYLRRLRLVR
jgi:hypothetical protein